MGLTYLDSCVVIHASEETTMGASLRSRIQESAGDRFVISPLVRLESLVRPLRTNDRGLLSRRTQILDGCESLEISERSYALATHIRATHGLDTADALHVATAGLADCDQIWTTDKQLVDAAPGFAVDVGEYG